MAWHPAPPLGAPTRGRAASKPAAGTSPGRLWPRRLLLAVWTVRVPLGLYLASRILVLLSSAAGGFIAGSSGRSTLRGPWPDIASTGSATINGLLRWDSAWYVDVSVHGYSANPSGAAGARNAFFPLFPALIR